MANKKNTKTRQKNYDDKSIRSIDKNIENSKVFDTKKLYAKHANEFHFDDTMLNDFDSLDTSFLDGNNKKRAKQVKKEVVRNTSNKRIKVKKKRFRPMNVVSFSIIILISIILGGLLTYICFYDKFNKTRIVTKTEVVKKIEVDENIVFYGDSIIEQYDVDKFYPDRNVINSGVSGNDTEDLVEGLEDRVYKYNPSKVFILIGTNDIIHDVETEEMVSNLRRIIDGIQKNRKYADIYVMSIFPINKDDEESKINLDMVNSKRKNSLIKDINREYKRLCGEEKITYINVYDKLLDDDGNLDIDYTKEGLHLIDDGYEVVTKCVEKYLN